MSLRSKLLVIFLALGVVPALAAGAVNCWLGTRAVERTLRADVETGATRAAGAAEMSLRELRTRLVELSGSRVMVSYMRAVSGSAAGNDAAQARPTESGDGSLPADVRAKLETFFLDKRGYFETVTCLGPDRQPLFQVRGGMTPDGRAEAQFRTGEFLRSDTETDARVWTVNAPEMFVSDVLQEQFGASVRLAVPVLFDDGTNGARGALVAKMKLASLFEAQDFVASPVATDAQGDNLRLVVALDRTGRIIYHTNRERRNQPVAVTMPFFMPVAERMKTGATGQSFYETRDGALWLAAYRPVANSGLSVAVAADYDSALANLPGIGWTSLVFVALLAALGAFLLAHLVGRTLRRVEQVAAGAAAVAQGNLDQRIETQVEDETRRLVESFNMMTDRLRALIAREAESKQFESFIRISAMLTHDLKNAITGLSMLVENFDRHFHREEFRADAVDALRDSADKLRRIVARLTEPVKSLSGEYRRNTRPTDLVSMIKRVLAVNVEPSGSLYKVVTKLPESLVIPVEAERMENVVENLVINAVEAMGAKGGRLTVEAGPERDGYVFFGVGDTGAGMSEEFLKSQLFRPFSTTKTRGVGLGLYTCREVVEMHGGRLEVRSEVGVGTYFRVVLPSVAFALRSSKEQPQQKTAVTSGGV